jgi:hypothetical protein
MSVVGAPLELSNGQMDGTVKRQVHDFAAAVLGLTGVGYDRHLALGGTATFPLAHVGVIDYAGFLAVQPTAGPSWPYQVGDCWFKRLRYGTGAALPLAGGVLPAAAQLFDPDDPARMSTYIGATGHVLFPFFVSEVPDCALELSQLVLQGAVAPSNVTI